MASHLAIEEILTEIGLKTNTWTSLEQIDAGCSFILENMDLLKNLPQKVRGNLSHLTSENTKKRRRCICALTRRLAMYTEQAIIRKRIQVYIDKKTVSKYSYKLVK
jgi:hypothetical protein